MPGTPDLELAEPQPAILYMSASAPVDPLEELRIDLAGRYKVERELGAGGMAVVYLAQDLQRGRTVALKVLRPEVGLAGGVERFDREIRLAARLVHPNILPLLDSGASGGRLWYTMPFIEGESLRARLDREKQLPMEEAVRLTGEMAEALGHAHAAGILHRDIKPENVLLASDHALIADFGIARALGDNGDRLTSTGLALGTPGYMSPEQSSGQQTIDARSDLYALGSVCYEMLAGEPPFTGPTAQAVIARRLSQPAPSIRTIRPSVPESVDAAIRRALAPVPADRFASTTEFARALSVAATGSTTIGTRPRLRWSRLAGIVVVGLAAWLAFRFISETATPRSGTADDAIRLAVLPFRLTGDPSDRYLAEGITEEVTSALANLGGLRVIDRSSVVPQAGSGKTARQIGAALRVDALLDGDVQKAGDVIRVRVRLIDPATEESKWSQSWNHTAQNVFQVQSEVATRVAGVLRIQLAERESRSLKRPPTTNPEAYDAYLRALAFDRNRGESNRSRAHMDSMVAMFTAAVRFDSTFAAAWASLGATLVSSVFRFGGNPEPLDQAEQAIRTALRLDSTVAMAWKASHDLKWNAARGWHFAASLADVRRALELQPSLVEAHNALGSLYFHYGFMDEARRELEISLSLDPSDGCDDTTRCTGFSGGRIARVLYYQQKLDSALARYEAIPFIGGFAWEKAMVLGAAGRAVEGLTLLDSVRQNVVENHDREAVRALLLITLGRTDEALVHLESVSTRPPTGLSHFHHAQFVIACTYAGLGRNREAVEWLRRAADNGMPNYPLFRNDPYLKGLQGDPAYESFMRSLEQEYQSNLRLVRSESLP